MPSQSTHPLALDPDRDPQVVARVLSGDRAAFEILMRRHNQRVYRSVRAVLRDDDEAEDAAQHAWVTAYEQLATWEGRSSFVSWVSRIAIHRAYRQQRRSKTHLRIIEATPDAAPPHTPEAEAARAHLRRILESKIDELPDTLRTVLVLRDIEELSGPETADVLELSGEAVRVRLHRARRSLRASLEEILQDRIGEAYPFLGARCNAIVAAVMARIGN